MAKATKEAISSSFKKLSKEKGLDHVTVEDIVKEADINRKTFYYHYDGLLSLIKELLVTSLREEIGERSAIDNWKEGFAACFECFLSQKEFIEEVIHSKYGDHLHHILEEVSLEMISRNLEEVREVYRNSKNEEYASFARDFDDYRELYSALILSIFEVWIDKGMKDDYQKYVEFIYLLFVDSIYGIVPKLR